MDEESVFRQLGCLLPPREPCRACSSCAATQGFDRSSVGNDPHTQVKPLPPSDVDSTEASLSVSDLPSLLREHVANINGVLQQFNCQLHSTWQSHFAAWRTHEERTLQRLLKDIATEVQRRDTRTHTDDDLSFPASWLMSTGAEKGNEARSRSGSGLPGEDQPPQVHCSSSAAQPNIEPRHSKFDKVPSTNRQTTRTSAGGRSGEKADASFSMTYRFTPSSYLRSMTADDLVLHQTAKEKSRTLGRASSRRPDSVQTSRWYERLQQIVNHAYFDRLVSFLVVCNAFAIGVQVQDTTQEVADHAAGLPLQYDVFNAFFVICLSVELGMRWAAAPSRFCHGEFKLWNFFDFALLIYSWFDVTVDLAVNMMDHALVRVLRNLRILRLMRLTRFSRPLRLLVVTIIGTIRSGLWTIALLVVHVYLFAVLFTQASHDRYATHGTWEDEDLNEYYGTLPRSLYTLFQSMSGGLDWQVSVKPLSSLNLIYPLLFTFYISFTFFVLMNVITGLFCHSAIAIVGADHDHRTTEHMKTQRGHVARLESLFASMDEHSTGVVTISDFERNLNNAYSQAYLASVLDIEVTNSWALFKVLDSDQDCVISKEDFVQGCLRLRGQARSVDMHKMLQEIRWQHRQINERLETLSCHKASGRNHRTNEAESSSPLLQGMQRLSESPSPYKPFQAPDRPLSEG
mmetsp:Transcript_46980/g.109513  ORF Transcript_46980/g.109513 Transcript_46980/m.109513 type:complete len:685 (+) Transcript_46980:27-2081(+)